MINLLKITAFTSLATVLFSGCSPVSSTLAFVAETANPKVGREHIDGIFIPREAVIEENKNIKVFYSDLTHELVKSDLKNIVNELNSKQPHTPSFWCEIKQDLEPECSKNTSGKTLDKINFSIDEQTGNIIGDKSYLATEDTYRDFYNIREYMFEMLNNNTELRESFGMSGILYANDNEIKNKKLSFTTARDLGSRFLKDDTRRQIEAGGWKMVASPEEADKIFTLNISRGISGFEMNDINKLPRAKREKVFPVYLSDKTKKSFSFDMARVDFYSDSISRDIHTRGNTNSTNAGVAAGGAFIALDLLLSSNAKKKMLPSQEYLLPFITIEDKVKDESKVFALRMGMLPDSKKGKEQLFTMISNDLNQFPENAYDKYEIK